MALFLYICLLPALVFFIVFNKKDTRAPFLSRFFLYKNPSFTKNRLWFHASSLGEVRSIDAITSHLDEPINLSVSTHAGYQQGAKITSQIRYLPYEIFLPFWTMSHKVFVVIEAELWYMLFCISQKKGAKNILLNARVTKKSFRRYYALRYLYKHIFAHIDTVFCQNKKDKKRLSLLGASNIQVVGNIKACVDIKTTREYKKPSGIIVCASSTHEKEEELVVKHFLALPEKNKRLFILPRHNYRFDNIHQTISQIAEASHLSYHRFSQDTSLQADIVLVDKMGEANNFYAISDIVILGGAFFEDNKARGHNPLEPAFFNCKLITGKYMQEQKSAFDLVNNFAICQNTDDLSNLLEQALHSGKHTTITHKPNINIVTQTIEKALAS